jgi:hypothetical protein
VRKYGANSRLVAREQIGITHDRGCEKGEKIVEGGREKKKYREKRRER